jgi:hypothetical protein
VVADEARDGAGDRREHAPILEKRPPGQARAASMVGAAESAP